MIYFMISTAKSEYFTGPAIESLKKATRFDPSDRIVLIDNDGALSPIPGVELFRNQEPKSFAENANVGLRLAWEASDDLMLLNNDIIFTEKWRERMPATSDAILVPSCNQNVQYDVDDMSIRSRMEFGEYFGKGAALDRAAELHYARSIGLSETYEELLISFFCVYLPLAPSRAIGLFDESFGRGGGEDVDYRLRAMTHGISVKIARRPYLLHFLGKSTWRSGEPRQETQAADYAYKRRFIDKWGSILSDMFLVGGDKRAMAEQYGVLEEFVSGDYVAMFNKLRSR